MNMHGYIPRCAEKEVAAALKRAPVVAILGARQSGKSTLFLRTSNGAEADLVLERGRSRVLIECKLTKAPAPSRGFHQLVEDLQPEAAWLVAPVDEPYETGKGIQVGHLRDIRLDAPVIPGATPPTRA